MIKIIYEDDRYRGYTQNGEEIDESIEGELYRIAENEILPHTFLGKIGDYVTIDEDTFEYLATGTAFGAYLKYTIYLEWGAEYQPNIRKFYTDIHGDVFHRDWTLDDIHIDFNIYVDGDKVTTEIADIDVYEPKNFEKVYDLDALCNAISKIAEKAAYEIKSKLSNI